MSKDIEDRLLIAKEIGLKKADLEELAGKIKQKEAKIKEYKEKKKLLDEAKYKEVMNYTHRMGNEQNIGHAEGLSADMRISRELGQALIDEYYNSVPEDKK